MKRLIVLMVFMFAGMTALYAGSDPQKAKNESDSKTSAVAEETVTAGQIKAVKSFTADEKNEIKETVVEKINDVIDKKEAKMVATPVKQYMKISKKLFEKSLLELKKGETAQATVTAGEAQAEATKEAIADVKEAKEAKVISGQQKKEQINEDLKEVKTEIKERKEVNKEIKAQVTEEVTK